MSDPAPPPPPGPPPPPPERPSFETVYKQEAAHVWRTLRRLGVAAKDCEDAVHEVFMIVVRCLPEYEDRGGLKRWLGGIARNVAARYHHGARRRPPTSDIDIADVFDSNLKVTIMDERVRTPEEQVAVRELVLRLLEEVEPDRRLILIMHDLDGHEDKLIAEVLGIPLGTVASRLRSARRDFEAALKRMQARERGPTRILLGLSMTALFDVEREIPPLPPGVEERIFARLAETPEFAHVDRPTRRAPLDDVAEAALKHGAAAITGAKAAIGGVVLFVLGGVLGALLDPLHRSPSATVVAAPIAAIVTAPGGTGEPLPETSAPAPRSPLPTESDSAATNALATEDVAAERALMSKASGALALGDMAAVLDVVQEHARRFRGGRLVEERETYWISALLRAGRTGEARDRIERLARSYRRARGSRSFARRRGWTGRRGAVRAHEGRRFGLAGPRVLR